MIPITLHPGSLLAGAAATSLVFVAMSLMQVPSTGGAASQPSDGGVGVQVHYLEIVTPDVEATCRALEELHGVRFSEPVAELGNACTAALGGGGLIGVRAPMHAAEEPVVRPYLLVDDIELAAETAEAAGGEIAHPPLEIPGRGKFAIYFQGGIEHGLWQL